MTATLTTVLGYVHDSADEEDLDSLFTAIKTRRKVLGERRAASVRIGTAVTLSGLSPKYLNGLTGTVETSSGVRAGVRLDERSTTDLRWSGKRFYIPQDTKEYLLDGVPKTSCIPS